jgi:hypothetical protein
MAGDQADLVAEPEPGHPAWPVIAVIGPRTVRVSLTIPRVTKAELTTSTCSGLPMSTQCGNITLTMPVIR